MAGREHEAVAIGPVRVGVGSWRRKRVQSAYAIGAAPIGAPGWPEFAFWTASIESVRIVSIARRSSGRAGEGHEGSDSELGRVAGTVPEV